MEYINTTKNSLSSTRHIRVEHQSLTKVRTETKPKSKN